MSSNPPTEPAATELPATELPAVPAARWRSPAGWSLRTRLVAAMIALLAVLSLVVGGITEFALQRTLYAQLNTDLANSQRQNQRFLGYEPDGSIASAGHEPDGAIDSRGGRPRGWQAPGIDDIPASRGPNGRTGGAPGQIVDTLVFAIKGDAAQGGVLKESDQDFTGLQPVALSPANAALLRTIPTDAKARTYDLEGIGDYRITARTMEDGLVVIAGLPLKEVEGTLFNVAAVATGITLLAILVAGWAGAVIVRRTLRPLSRVAATAGRVSELRLDRGEVDLAQRVPEADTDPRTEVGQVGAALNRMLDHVGTALERRHASEMQVRQFVADASHELRTPLAAIRGYAELSRRSRTPVPDDVAHVLRRVESEAKRMTTLVEDLLLLARLDAGRPLAQDAVDLTMLVVDAVSDAHAAGPRHDWQLDVPEEPITVTGDAARLHQVLANLLANARTHTPEGTTVTVALGVTGDEAVLRVIDAGPGIPQALLPHIFERFARGDSSRSRAAGSTGLGLSIVHAVVTAHHGTVGVHTTPGRTEFTVRLPLTVPEARRQAAVPQDLAQLSK